MEIIQRDMSSLFCCGTILLRVDVVVLDHNSYFIFSSFCFLETRTLL